MAQKIYKVTKEIYDILKSGESVKVLDKEYRWEEDALYTIVDYETPEYSLKQEDNTIYILENGVKKGDGIKPNHASHAGVAEQAEQAKTLYQDYGDGVTEIRDGYYNSTFGDKSIYISPEEERIYVENASNYALLTPSSLAFGGNNALEYGSQDITKGDYIYNFPNKTGTLALISDIPTGAAANKGVDTSISAASNSTNLPTSKAVAAFVEGKGYVSNVTAAAGTNITSVGTPSVTASTSNGVTTLTFNYLKGAKGDTGASSEWFTGTAITGTSTTAKAFSSSGISAATVGDMYLNSSTYNVYRCETAGNASAAKWKYICNIKGAAGSNGTNGTNGTSVTITNISQNNTAGGTSTVTFSDGKTLSIKNGTNGTNATTTAVATTSANGLMSAADKTKLNGIASGAEVNVQSDWSVTNTSSDAYIKNKPSLAAVATSGSYNDLSNKPTIPTVNNATLTIQKNGTTVNTFTANASSNVTANITVPTSFSDLSSRGESWLEWGGKNFSGSYGPIDAAIVPELGANRLAFVPAAAVYVEYSRDGGATWTNYSPSDADKINFFNGNGNAGFTIGKATTSSVATNQYQVRINLYTSAGSVYTVLNKFVIYVSTNGTNANWCTIRARTQQNYENNVNTWITFANKVSVSGWSGYNVINTSGLTTYGNTKEKASQYGHIQFIFGCDTGSSGTYAGLTIYKIFGFGGVGWTTPATLAKTGHMYTYDASKNVTFPAGVSATSFIENGTTLSNKYLGKAATAADSSKLNGKEASYYLNYTNLSNRPTAANGNIVIGNASSALTDSGVSLTTLREIASGATNTYVAKNKKESFTLASSSITTQPAEGTKAIRVSEIKDTTGTVIALSKFKVGDVVLLTAVDEPDWFVATTGTGFITLAELETRKINLEPYETKANAITGLSVSGKTITYTKGNGTTGTITTQDTTYNNATTSAAGLMSKDDKTKLNGITSGATKVEASTTNGKIKINGTETTVYTHPGSGTNPHGTTKTDVGLGNVGNFKAVSTVASQGLTSTEKSNARANIGAGTSSLTLGTTATTAAKGDHTHDGRYYTEAESDSRFAPISHTHNYLEKTTYEWNKEFAAGSNGAVSLGRYNIYDSQLTFDIDCTTTTAMSGKLVIATQNGQIKEAKIFGNASKTLVSYLKIYQSAISNNRSWIEIFCNFPGWSKNKVHIYGVALNSSTITNQMVSVTFTNGVPSGVTSGDTLWTGTIGNDTSPVATTSVDGLMSAADKTKLNGIAIGANKYSLPAATSSTLGGVKTSTGITNSSGTISVAYGTAAGTACQGNDSRLSDSRTPKSHTHGNITNDGKITSTAVTAATGVLVYDSNNKIQRATAAQTRSIIGAGTSNLAIGTTSTTAAAGNHTHSVATTSANGLMSKEDKAKLDTISHNYVKEYNTGKNGMPGTITNNGSSIYIRSGNDSINVIGEGDEHGVGISVGDNNLVNFYQDRTEMVDAPVKIKQILAPTASNGSTYGLGTSGQVLKSNGTSVYWANDSTTSGSGDTYYMHKIVLQSISNTNYKAYITVYNKSSTAFTAATFKTWLINKQCTGSGSAYSCTGIASTVGSVVGIYTNGTDFYFVHTSASSASGSTYKVSQPLSLTDKTYAVN